MSLEPTNSRRRGWHRRLAAIGACVATVAAGAHGAAAPYPTEFADPVEARGHLPGERLPAVAPRPRELEGPQRVPVVRRVWLDADGRPRARAGALSGKSVYLSPGHGWTYTASTGWGTQRPNLQHVVEDLSNVDGINEFLVPYLLGAGALVVPVREIDATDRMVIVDNDDGTQHPERGLYQERGDTSQFLDSTLDGWAAPPQPITGSTNPFALGSNRLIWTSPTETARAVLVPNVPASGYYNVHIAYSMYKGRASDAHIIVAHPGGEAHFLVDQRRHGGTWVLLGRFYFEKGTNETRGAVIVTNDSQDAGSTVSVDAVRLGGGSGVIDRGGGTSGYPRADECARYHGQFSGAPASVYNPSTGTDRTDDITARSRFADWVHAPGEPAVYISHHSNAFNGTIRGTETYIYGPNPPNGSYQPTSQALALGSDKLAKAVHQEVIGDLRAAYDPSWTDRKVKSAYFGEINPSYQDEMASMLIEIAFHDQDDDIMALKDPAFRRLVARAIYKGIVKYFAGVDGVPAHLLPEPPSAVLARNTAPGEVTVSWTSPPSGGVLGDPADSYRVYRSANGRAFDQGRDTAGGTSLKLTGLSPGRVVYLRVTAVNQGGESLPSPTLAVGVSATGTARIALVSAFDRCDPDMNLEITYPKLSVVERLYLEHMNSRDYLVEHGHALRPFGLAFDAATHAALAERLTSPREYELVIWQGGKGLSDGGVMEAEVMHQMVQAAGSGTSLIMTGSCLARRLGGSAATTAQQEFLTEILRARFISADQPHDRVAPASSGPLQHLAPWQLSTWETGPYDTNKPDVIEAIDGETAALYQSAEGAGAVSWYGNASRCAVLAGFPLETVVPAQRRTELLARLFEQCAIHRPGGWDGGWIGDGGPPDLGPLPDGPPLDAAVVDASGDAEPQRDAGDDGCGCRLSGRPGPRGGSPWLAALALAVLGGALWRRGRAG